MISGIAIVTQQLPRAHKACEIVAAVEGPAVIPEPGLAIEQVLDVDQELALGLLDIMRTVENLADARERQHAHH